MHARPTHADCAGQPLDVVHGGNASSAAASGVWSGPVSGWASGAASGGLPPWATSFFASNIGGPVSGGGDSASTVSASGLGGATGAASGAELSAIGETPSSGVGTMP